MLVVTFGSFFLSQAIGNRLLITRNLYESLVELVRVFREFLMRTSKRYKSRLEETLGAALMSDVDKGPHRVDADIQGGSTASTSSPGIAKFDNGAANLSSGGKCNDGAPSDRGSFSCDLCLAAWTPATISAFETISADIHRTLPRLGVVRVVPRDTQDSIHEADTAKTSESQAMAPVALSDEQTSFSCSTEAGVRPLPLALRRDGQQLYSRLRLLLETFVLLRPDVGYVQGMGFLAAMLLLYMEDDYEAFVCFANLLVSAFLAANVNREF